MYLSNVTQGTSVWEALTAVGTLSAVLMALFGPGIRAWWRSPRLEIAYKPCDPYCRYTPLITGDQHDVASLWVRVKVTNKGRGIARRCKGKMIAIFGPDGSQRRDRDPMLLRWSSTPSDREFEPLDLARGESQFLDVVYTYDGATAALIPAEPTPAGFPKSLEHGPAHRVTLAVYADNAELEPVDFVITYDGNVDSLKMNWA